MPGLFTSPGQAAQQSATATGNATSAEIGQEENYVNTSEANLRGVIAGLGPNPYFTPPAPPGAVDPKSTASFSTPGPKGTTTAPDGGNLFAAAPPSNLFAPSQTRQPQPVARATAATT